jgi:PAS domain S-box-containing protein
MYEDEPSSVTDGEVQQALDERLRDALVPITAALAPLYGFFVVADYYTMPHPVGYTAAAVNVGMCLGFLAVHALLRFGNLAPRRAHLVATLLALVILANSFYPYYALRDPVQTTYLMLLVLGVGVFFFRWSATITVVTATLAAWAAGALRASWDLTWATFCFALLSAAVLGLLAQGVRLREQRRLEHLRIFDERRKHQLEAAVEAALQSEQRFRSLAEATSEGIVVHDDRRILDHNPAFARLFGWPDGEVDGHAIHEFLTPDSVTRLEAVGPAGTSTPLDAQGVRRDGAIIPIQVSMKLAPHDGHFVRLLAIRDLSPHTPILAAPTPPARVPRTA